METVTLTIPTEWLKGQNLSQDELRKALQLGLDQMYHQQRVQESAEKVVEALIRTGRVKHLASLSDEPDAAFIERQHPPTLSGPPLSDILIAQRRGEG